MSFDTAPRDIVHTISDWYDGPRAGAAEFQGRAYWYRSVYLDTAEWDPDEDRFELTLLTDDALSWELETMRIFERWNSAREAGAIVWVEGDESTFGALPEDRDRYRDLNDKLQRYLSKTKPELIVHGRFESSSSGVCWRIIDSSTD